MLKFIEIELLLFVARYLISYLDHVNIMAEEVMMTMVPGLNGLKKKQNDNQYCMPC